MPVERDKQGTAGRKTRPMALKRLTTSALRLVEGVVDDRRRAVQRAYEEYARCDAWVDDTVEHYEPCTT